MSGITCAICNERPAILLCTWLHNGDSLAVCDQHVLEAGVATINQATGIDVSEYVYEAAQKLAEAETSETGPPMPSSETEAPPGPTNRARQRKRSQPRLRPAGHSLEGSFTRGTDADQENGETAGETDIDASA